MEWWAADKERAGAGKQKGIAQDGYRAPSRNLNPTFPVRGGGGRAKPAASMGP